MVGAGDSSNDDSLGPGILEVVSAKRCSLACLSGAAEVFIGAASLKYFGDGLVMFVVVCPVGRGIAAPFLLPVSQLVGDADEFDAFKPAPENGRRDVTVEGVVKLVVIWIEVYEVTVAITIILSSVGRRILAGSPLLAEEGDEMTGIVVIASLLAVVCPAVVVEVVAVVGQGAEVELFDITTIGEEVMSGLIDAASAN